MMYSQKKKMPTKYQVGGPNSPQQPPQQQEQGEQPGQDSEQGQDPKQDKIQQIIAGVTQQLQKGMPPKEIEKSLVKMGFSKKQGMQLIQTAMQQVQQAQQQQQQPAPAQGQPVPQQ